MQPTEADYLLMHGLSAESLADFLGVSIRHARRYKCGAQPLPEPCRKLLRLRQGDLSALLGNAWHGYHLDARRGLLCAPNFERGMTPRQISAMFFTYQEVAALKAQVRDLQAKVWAAGKVRDAERSGSMRAKLLQHAEALRVLSDAIAADLDSDLQPAPQFKL